MARGSKAILKSLHSAIKNGDVNGHILAPHVTAKDMDVLKAHLDSGTLMQGLTAVADAPNRAAAVRDMPADLGRIFAKVPATTVREFSTHPNTLHRDSRGVLGCDC